MLAKRLRTGAWQMLLSLALVSAAASSGEAQTFKVLYSFTGGTDGGGVWSGVVIDKQGNVYGTTAAGGLYGYGTTYELSPNSDGTWSETVLHSFMLNDRHGFDPMGSLIFDAAGNLYGTAASGGQYGAGTVFELTPGSYGWSLARLYSLGAYRADAGSPSNLLMDSAGNLYGTGNGGIIGSGAIFELSPGSTGWSESVIYSFGTKKGVGGYGLGGGVIFDAAGDLYGVTTSGGDLSCGSGNGCGVVYELQKTSTGWRESVLHSFAGPPNDGETPGTELLAFDQLGSLYGTTLNGGGTGCAGFGCGTILKVTHGSGGWKESVIHQFGDGSEGASPTSGLTFDAAGNAYGVTGSGGSGCGCGVVYKLTPKAHGQWSYSVLRAFTGSDGAMPAAGLIRDDTGNLYGTTVVGGSGGDGVVFEITP